MVNIHKQFGGTGLGSMLSLDGIDCNNAYAGEAEEESADKQYDTSSDSLRDRDRDRVDEERVSQEGHTSNTPPQ